MSYLLDTNVVSEWTKPEPDPGVVQWLHHADEDRLFLSVATLAELRFGMQRMPVGVRRERLATWVTEQLVLRFQGRIVPVDAEVADEWGRILARAQAIGRPVGAMDGLIAASATCRQLTVVTRNTDDFAPLDVVLLNPWLR